MLRRVVITFIFVWLSSQSVLAESNQQLADIVATNPKAEIQNITSNMAAVIPDLPTSATQTLWNAGVDGDAWEQARLDRLVVQVRDAEKTMGKVQKYKQQYMYVFKHRTEDDKRIKKWLMRVGGAIFQMKKQGKIFEQRIRYLKKSLPQMIKTTAQMYKNANGENKKILKVRLQTQLRCFEVMDFPVDADITQIQSELVS